jgi:hypothetical protein
MLIQLTMMTMMKVLQRQLQILLLILLLKHQQQLQLVLLLLLKHQHQLQLVLLLMLQHQHQLQVLLTVLVLHQPQLQLVLILHLCLIFDNAISDWIAQADNCTVNVSIFFKPLKGCRGIAVQLMHRTRPQILHKQALVQVLPIHRQILSNKGKKVQALFLHHLPQLKFRL